MCNITLACMLLINFYLNLKFCFTENFIHEFLIFLDIISCRDKSLTQSLKIVLYSIRIAVMKGIKTLFIHTLWSVFLNRNSYRYRC